MRIIFILTNMETSYFSLPHFLFIYLKKKGEDISVLESEKALPLPKGEIFNSKISSRSMVLGCCKLFIPKNQDHVEGVDTGQGVTIGCSE